MDQFLEQLNDTQREAVVYNDGPSLIIAGAGSGKTRVLTYKIAWLLKNGISPYNILALTFTNKAAREMKNRIAPIVGEDTARRLWMGTFHSIFSRILRREAERIGYKSDFTIYDAQDSRNLIRSIIKEMGLDDKVYKPASVQARISSAKNARITASQYASDKNFYESDRHAKREELHKIYSTYQARCRTAGALDFDDLLLHTYLLFNEHPDVAERYRNQFRFILVDEYQDTNSVQHEIVRQLAADHHRVCVVGDDAQSIYSFRGANISNILHFRQTYPESKLFKLERNYRSTQTIVNAANSLIRHNKDQIPKSVFSKKEKGESIQVIGAWSDYEEGYNVTSRIAEMRMLNRYEYGDFAVLYRTNAQSRILEETLRKINIPYRIYGGLSFYQRKEIKDVIAYMRLVVNPDDEEALKRVINYPARGIGDTTLNKIITSANQQGASLWQVLTNPREYNLNINKGTETKLEGFARMIESFREVSLTHNAHETGVEIIQGSGLSYELQEDRSPEGISRKQNIDELTNSLYDYCTSRMEEGNPDIQLRDFLADIALLTDQDTDRGENDSRVTLMTVHASKGLEFKNVFVVGLEENLFPSENCKNPQELEEERRLFYVAITRAEENVVLTYAKSRYRNGQSLTTRPSRFIREIDPEYLRIPSDPALGLRIPGSASDHPAAGTSASTRSYGGSPKTEGLPRSGKLYKITPTPKDVVSRQSIGDLRIGSTILHERFGRGKVTDLTGENENEKATVEFDTFGKKQLLLRFARFDIVE